MKLRMGRLIACAAALGALSFASDDARACGGCFHEEDADTTVVTAHRMAFAVSPTHTVLWDQVEYAGTPASFAWVLPVKAGAYIELSTDAWFETLDAATSTRVFAPLLDCSDFDDYGDDYYYDDYSPDRSGCSMGCGSDEGSGTGGAGWEGAGGAYGAGGSGYGGSGSYTPPVTVVHQGSVGPYETVTLHANVPNALPDWLTSHGYAIDAEVAPVIAAYEAEGFDFIALRLLPDQGVQQMKPVRVVSPGASTALPLRMVAAGTGANVSITLFVIGEGRWQVANFPIGEVDTDEISWDFETSESNYALLRQELLGSNGGTTWSTAYARQGALLSEIINPLTDLPVEYSGANGTTQSTIGQLYVARGLTNGETRVDDCADAFDSLAGSPNLVVDPCPHEGGIGGAGGAGTGGGGAGGAGTGGASTGGAGGAAPCGMVGAGEIDARVLACGPLDDMAVALTGMHPKDVWLTRLESSLPHAALADDLSIEAAPDQVTIENWLAAGKSPNAPCPLLAAGAPRRSARHEDPTDRRRRNREALTFATLAAIAATFARRARRPKALLAAR